MDTTNLPLPRAKDLLRQPPASPRRRTGGYVILSRMADKGRATLNGTNGEYHFNCPLDNMLFSFKGVQGEDVLQLLLSGASDEDVVHWLDAHGTPRSPEDIKEWSDETERLTFFNHPEKGKWFTDECVRLGLDPAQASLFDMLEADDLVSHHLLAR